MQKTTSSDVGRFLEARAKTGEPLTYSQLRDNFPDLPLITAAWLSHPLSQMFGQLDREDAAAGKPFRTSLVVAAESGRPGEGFYKMLTELKGITILKSERDAIWLKELGDLRQYYQS